MFLCGCKKKQPKIYPTDELKYHNNKKSHLLCKWDFFNIKFPKYDYSLAAKYLSASRAAIQPVPAAVIA
jgi:hypothetical protein